MRFIDLQIGIHKEKVTASSGLIKNGLIPDDENLVGAMIKNICYANAKNYMAFPGVDEPVKAKKSR